MTKTMDYATALDVVVEAAEGHHECVGSMAARKIAQALDVIGEGRPERVEEIVEPPRRTRWDGCPVCGATAAETCFDGCVAIDAWGVRDLWATG